VEHGRDVPGFLIKDKFKEFFPELNLFDSEDYTSEDWFANNMRTLKVFRAMFVMVPDFPFSLIALEAGFFYATYCSDYSSSLKNLVICWPEIVRPNFVKKKLYKLGHVVSTVEKGVKYFRTIL